MVGACAQALVRAANAERAAAQTAFVDAVPFGLFVPTRETPPRRVPVECAAHFSSVAYRRSRERRPKSEETHAIVAFSVMRGSLVKAYLPIQKRVGRPGSR